MVDPFSAGKALLTAGSLALKVKSKLESLGATADIQEALAVDHRAWRAERDAAVERRLLALEAASGPDAAPRVELMLADRQFLKLQANLEWEALRESTDERRRMLAYLAAGLTDPHMSINLKARIERTARGLDPDDVLLLRDVFTNPSTATQEARTKQPTNFYALVSAGCISEDDGTWGSTPKATELGRQLLAILEPYIAVLMVDHG